MLNDIFNMGGYLIIIISLEKICAEIRRKSCSTNCLNGISFFKGYQHFFLKTT